MKPLFFSLLLGVICLFSFGSTIAQGPSNTVPVSELRNSPFTAGPLKITFTNFKERVLIGNVDRNFGYRASIETTIENTSDEFTTFDPRYLSIVDSDRNQSDVLGLNEEYGTNVLPAETRRIAPKATIKVRYILTEPVHLPSRIYYHDMLLGSISK
jgi:hypothetical protein